MKRDDTSAVPPVPSLVEDYKAREAQLQQQVRDLERRRQEVRDAAERTASEIVTSARQDIRRIVIKARQDLFALKSQLDAVGCPPDDSFDPAALLSQIPLDGDERPAQLAATVTDYPEPAPAVVEPEAAEIELEPIPDLPSAAHEIWTPDRRSAASSPRRGVWADPSVREDAPPSTWWKPAAVASVLVVAAAVALTAFVLVGGRNGANESSAGVRAASNQSGVAVSESTHPAPPVMPAPPVPEGAEATSLPPIAPQAEDVADGPPMAARTEAVEARRLPLQPAAVDVPADLMVTAAPAVARESTPTTTDPQTRAAEQEILARDRQWFDAFYRGDRTAMAAVATPGFAFTDQRAPGHIVAMGTTARRSLDKIRIDFAGVGAVLTAQMTEQTPGLAGERQIVSMLSGIWTKGDDGWRLMGVRLTTP